MTYRFIGKSLMRTEDARLVSGQGQYTSDLAPSDSCRLFVVRSPYASARFRVGDVGAAAAAPGVLLVLTPDSPEIRGLGSFSSRLRRTAPSGKPNFEPRYPVLAAGVAQFVGDAIAGIFADTLDAAKSAADLLEVAWEERPSVTDTARAAEPGAARVWEEMPDNCCFVHDEGDAAGVAAALEAAPLTVSLSYPVTRVTAAPMEPRTALATYDRREDLLTLHAGLQNPHYVREELAERVLGIPGNRLRVVAPDVGGAFGMKESPYPEYALALVGARRLGRPVLWVCERAESFLSDHQARDHACKVTLGLDEDGTFLAIRYDAVSNIGAYIAFNGLHTPVNNLGGLSGVYRTPRIHARITGVFTNTPPTAPYRGAGRPEAIYAVERAIDLAARRHGFDRLALRRRNMISPEEMPFETRFVYTYDSGMFERNMDDALALSEWQGFASRREVARARGRLAGIGLANAIEIANGPVGQPFAESADVSFDSTGSVTVTLGTHSQGQGHQVTFAQIAADLLGLEVEDVRVRCGDTEQIEHGLGTFGSRSVAAAGAAVKAAADGILTRAKDIAARHLGIAREEVTFEDGLFGGPGTNARLSIKDAARLAFRMRPDQLGGRLGLTEKRIVSPAAPSFPNACHVCEVEIDAETGECFITRYTVVDDVGRVINPMLVKGQIHGGVAQGVGQILGERIAYADNGQLLSGSFMDYVMPRGSDLPAIVTKNNEVPTTGNPLGVKGAGEAGTVGALAAVTNAIVDALSELGVEQVDMPATSDRIWRSLAPLRR
jgi:carbon-monoxide dehydrogenase large subunit